MKPEDWDGVAAKMRVISAFQRARQLVDAAITEDGTPVDAVERNKRVLAVEYRLRNGEPESGINARATLTTIRLSSDNVRAGTEGK